MKKITKYLLIVLILGLNMAYGQEEMETNSENMNNLVILWTSGDKEVFTKVVFPYAYNSLDKEWWNEVTIIVWGPSAKLLSEDKDLQDDITILKDTGVVLKSCKWCADQYEVAEDLEKLGIEVKYMGKELTDFMQGEEKVMVF